MIRNPSEFDPCSSFFVTGTDFVFLSFAISVSEGALVLRGLFYALQCDAEELGRWFFPRTKWIMAAVFW